MNTKRLRFPNSVLATAPKPAGPADKSSTEAFNHSPDQTLNHPSTGNVKIEAFSLPSAASAVKDSAGAFPLLSAATTATKSSVAAFTVPSDEAFTPFPSGTPDQWKLSGF